MQPVLCRVLNASITSTPFDTSFSALGERVGHHLAGEDFQGPGPSLKSVQPMLSPPGGCGPSPLMRRCDVLTPACPSPQRPARAAHYRMAAVLGPALLFDRGFAGFQANQDMFGDFQGAQVAPNRGAMILENRELVREIRRASREDIPAVGATRDQPQQHLFPASRRSLSADAGRCRGLGLLYAPSIE